MASYRFCRSDDVPLLVRAYNACYRVHFPDLPEMTVDRLKRYAREIDLWASSCMVASIGTDPIAVMLATKREAEALIVAVGTHPDHQRQGHGKHLLTSLGAKLAILGPPRLVAEVPGNQPGARAFVEACGYREECVYTDFILAAPAVPGDAPDMLIPTTVDELVANGVFDIEARRCWARSPATLLNRADQLQGLAIATETRIEAYLLFEDPEDGAYRELLALDCVAPARREMWLRLLVGHAAGPERRPLRIARVHSEEIPNDLLVSCGFVPADLTSGCTAVPAPA